MRYLVTGHTGFKGTWLSLMLHSMGHEVVGLALDPEPGGLFERARVGEVLAADLRVDIRDASALRDAVRAAAPDVIVHLAAQALVRESYRDPRTTFETNVTGTYNVLEASESLPGLRAHLVITTDKVYRNVDQIWGYRESDPLGGVDPYSASKAAADRTTWPSPRRSPRRRPVLGVEGSRRPHHPVVDGHPPRSSTYRDSPGRQCRRRWRRMR